MPEGGRGVGGWGPTYCSVRFARYRIPGQACVISGVEKSVHCGSACLLGPRVLLPASYLYHM